MIDYLKILIKIILILAGMGAGLLVFFWVVCGHSNCFI